MRADFFALREPDCSIWENKQVHAQNNVKMQKAKEKS